MDTKSPLYLIEILHQTTTLAQPVRSQPELYLIEILHQTTTMRRAIAASCGCILSKFYIKPQRNQLTHIRCRVVSYRNSTSNHNLWGCLPCFSALYLIEILHQTTTRLSITERGCGLYLIEILHQTTTSGLILIDKVLLTGCLPL